jgi:hypothetical protein
VVLADLIGKFQFGAAAGTRSHVTTASRVAPVAAAQQRVKAVAESRSGAIGNTALKTESWEEF